MCCRALPPPGSGPGAGRRSSTPPWNAAPYAKKLCSSVPAEKLSASEVRFRMAVPANGTATLTYTVQLES